MEIDLLNSASEDQIEMVMTMTMMQQVPELYGVQLAQTESNLNLMPPSPPFSNLPLPWAMVQEPCPGDAASPCLSSFPGSATTPSQKKTMREMIFRIAAMQPIHIDPESVKPPKRRNVKVSKDPQSVAARHRRERISERIRILQRLVPGGTKMDTASMLDQAIHYVKFLKTQVQSLERAAAVNNRPTSGIIFPAFLPLEQFGDAN